MASTVSFFHKCLINLSLVSLACGGTSSENCTYITQTSTTSSPVTSGSCEYTICKCDSDICRIRFDFTTLTVAGPTTASLGSTVTNDGSSIGDCTTDSFSITSPGNVGSPIICGFNDGQHSIYYTKNTD